jgi:hypothetical protein
VCPAASCQRLDRTCGALPGHAEAAVSWHSGFRGGAHARRKTARGPYAAGRRCGRVAARGTRSAGGPDAADRRADERHCDRGETPVICGSLRPGTAPTRMERRSKYPHRCSLERRRRRSRANLRSAVDRANAGRDPGLFYDEPHRDPASHQHRPSRVRAGLTPVNRMAG